MIEPDWKEITSVPPEHLVDPALELHRAVQLVASAAQTFAEPRGDDGHRAMTWDARLRAFVGVPFAGPYPFRMALRPEDLTLVLLDRLDETLGSLPLVGVTRDEAYEWMSIGMATYLGGAPPKIERPEYDTPEHTARTARFTGGTEAARRTLAALYGGVALLIAELIEDRTTPRRSAAGRIISTSGHDSRSSPMNAETPRRRSQWAWRPWVAVTRVGTCTSPSGHRRGARSFHRSPPAHGTRRDGPARCSRAMRSPPCQTKSGPNGSGPF